MPNPLFAEITDMSGSTPEHSEVITNFVNHNTNGL